MLLLVRLPCTIFIPYSLLLSFVIVLLLATGGRCLLLTYQMLSIIQAFNTGTVFWVVVAQVAECCAAFPQDRFISRVVPKGQNHQLRRHGAELSLVFVAVVGDILDAPARYVCMK